MKPYSKALDFKHKGKNYIYADPIGTPGTGTIDPVCGACGCSVGIWQKAFHQEAMSCVEAMRSVVDTALASHAGSRLEDWRKVDLKATAQLQQHVKELAAINCNLDEFLAGASSSDNLSQFRTCLNLLQQRAAELDEARRALPAAIEIAAEKAAEKVVQAWGKVADEQSANMRIHAEEERLQWCANSVQWTRLREKIESYEGAQLRLEDAVKSQGEKVDAFTEAHRNSIAESKDMLTEGLVKIDQVSKQNFNDFGKNIREGLGFEIHGLNERLVNLFSTHGVAGRLFGQVADKQDEVFKMVKDDVARLKKKLLDLGTEANSLRVAADAGEEAKVNLNGCKKELRELRNKVCDLTSNLEQNTKLIEETKKLAIPNAMKRLQEIECNGFISFDRTSGEVALLTPIEFVDVKPSTTEAPPTPEIANSQDADSLIADLAKVAQVCKDLVMHVRVTVAAAKGGSPSYWDKMAKLRADVLRLMLEAEGVPSTQLNVVSGIQKGKQVVPDLVINVDPDVFRCCSPHQSSGGKVSPVPGAKKKGK